MSTSEMRVIMKALILSWCKMVLFILAQPYSLLTLFVKATFGSPFLFLQCFLFLSLQLNLSKDKGERLSPKSDHYGPGDGSDNKESTTLSCSTPPLSSLSIHIT